jgi:hypothetical protein
MMTPGKCIVFQLSLYLMCILSAAFYLLIMSYFVASVLVAYDAIRAYRHVKRCRDQSVALPSPVYETAARRSPFSFVRTNGWGWHGWKKLPVPWTRSSAGSLLQSKAAGNASMKDVHGNGDQVQNDQGSPYPSLVDIDDESWVQNNQDRPSAYHPLVDVDDTDVETSADAVLVVGDHQILSGTSPISPTLSPVPFVGFPIPSSFTEPSSQVDQPDWDWTDDVPIQDESLVLNPTYEADNPWADDVPMQDEPLPLNPTYEADDPWADRVLVQDESLPLNPTYDELLDSNLRPVTQDHQSENGFMETSPTYEVSHLSLDDGPSEERQLSHVVRGQLGDEDEEDATPKPTPIFIAIQLPVSDDGRLSTRYQRGGYRSKTFWTKVSRLDSLSLILIFSHSHLLILPPAYLPVWLQRCHLAFSLSTEQDTVLPYRPALQAS